MTKVACRKIIKSRLAAVSGRQFTSAGQKAARYLQANLPEWEKVLSALVFISLKDEINTLPIIETALGAEKRIFVPKIERDTMIFCRIDRQILPQGDRNIELPENLVTGAFGILEPVAGSGAALAPEDFPALVITPGRAFDRHGRRLGRGRGYYDRFFAALDAGSLHGAPAGSPLPYTAIGLCLNCQLLEEVPAENHDKTMDAILTEQGLYPAERNLTPLRPAG